MGGSMFDYLAAVLAILAGFIAFDLMIRHLFYESNEAAKRWDEERDAQARARLGE